MPELPNAACRDPQVADLFTGRIVGRSNNLEAAKRVCGSCWDRRDCLAWGLEHEVSGIWGGHAFTGLRALREEFGIPLQLITLAASGYGELWGSRS